MRPQVDSSARSGPDQVPMPGPDSVYWAFYEGVARRQLADWLPAQPQRVLDLSGAGTVFAAALASAGHDVIHVYADAAAPALANAEPAPATSTGDPGRVRAVVADGHRLDWLGAGVVDVVLAESRALSMCLAAEMTMLELARVLRPGGRVLLCVDSLLLGLARLAEQGRWAELADVPAADVVLVPVEDGSITRCFWPEELRTLLEEAGFEVGWVRPRTVLSPAVIERALASEPAALPALIDSELGLSHDREGELIGIHLLASARKSPAAQVPAPR